MRMTEFNSYRRGVLVSVYHVTPTLRRVVSKYFCILVFFVT